MKKEATHQKEAARDRSANKKASYHISFKRLGQELIQHIFAAATMAAVAVLLLNSHISVESINGPQVYNIFPADAGQTFEDSEIFYDLFRNAVSDITQLVGIKEQLETDGVLNSAKKIDVTEYAVRIDADAGCRVTALYELDDLIKWGKYGVDFTDRTMSLTEFVNYFGNCIYPENFKLDTYGQLTFDNFYKVVTDEDEETASEENFDEETDDVFTEVGGKSEEQIREISEKLKGYKREQLEDLVFSYIMAQNLKDLEVSREIDGILTVRIPMVKCRYASADGIKQLTGYADNWVDYMRLQNNLVAVVNELKVSYQRYQVFENIYRAENSNIKYMIRMTTSSGVRTYTNIPEEWQNANEYDVTEFFSEYRRYLIYYPDSLSFMGNMDVSEEELDGFISAYNYAYPGTTYIWLGVDIQYAVKGDAFSDANAIYQKIVPNINWIIGAIGLMTFIWLGIGIYLTVTAGIVVDENGERTFKIKRFDRIWTEVFGVLALVLAWGAVAGYRLLENFVESADVTSLEILKFQITRLYRYGVFALYGVYVSLILDIIWYSLVRRMRAGNLWRCSLLRKICKGLNKAAKFVFRHKNVAVSMILPYNIFLFLNLVGIVMVYRFLEQKQMWYSLLIIVGLIALDVIVGTALFRKVAEQEEIVEGINRIRDGEVEFILDSEKLHGSSRELADAVNNIGEGIRKAVKTSMKDEQMKTDLITNVSHDIKTPLTSIINYVDLLKRLKIKDEPAKGYIDILDGKAQRLKQLTDDLVEASKISSGNIVLNKEKLNLTELINQSIGEFSEKLEEMEFQVIFEERDVPAYIYADSRRMWRVAENLFNNICKYALEGTRVYIDVFTKEGRVEASVKNISRQRMNIRSDELTERFIRGDSSRSTEGSGLGLSIAKSLVQLQGGSFDIYLDGDLFKVTLTFPEYNEKTVSAGDASQNIETLQNIEASQNIESL